MSTSVNTTKARNRSFVPTSALAKALEFDTDSMRVVLTDGRTLTVPLAWFPILKQATPPQREHYKIGGGGVSHGVVWVSRFFVSLHWPDLDEDLSIAGLMAGANQPSR